jgi:hypothetical protein
VLRAIQNDDAAYRDSSRRSVALSDYSAKTDQTKGTVLMAHSKYMATDAEPEVTPEMVEAGSLVLLSRNPRYYDEGETVAMIYRAMRRLVSRPSHI